MRLEPSDHRSNEHTARISAARDLVKLAPLAGLAIEDLIRAVPELGTLGDPEARIDGGILLRGWSLLAESSDDPFFGLRAAEALAPGGREHVVDLMLRHCETVGDAFEQYSRYVSLVHGGANFSVTIDGDVAVIRRGPLPGRPRWPRPYAEFVSVYTTRCAYVWSGVHYPVLGASFMHAPPRDLRVYRKAFGDDLRFHAPINEVRMPARHLSLPFRHRDPGTHRYLLLRLSQLLGERQRAGAFAQVAATHVDALLRRGEPTLRGLARELALSERTLLRRLSAEKVRYVDLLDDARRRLALELIEAKERSVSELAEATGYRDRDAFRAAFRRWTGKSPRELRAELRA